MLNLLSKWLRKIVSDAHNAIVSVIVLASLPLLYFYGDRILNQTTRALNRPMPLWVMVSTALGVLLICLLVLNKALAAPKEENKKVKLDNKAIEMLRTIAAIENPLNNDHDMSINQQFLADTLKLSPQKTKHYIEQLVEADLIIYTIYGDLNGLTADGRKYLNDIGIMP